MAKEPVRRSSSVTNFIGTRILAVVPGNFSAHSFIFARRQIGDITQAGLNVQTFHIRDRLSLTGLFREWRRLRQTILQFRPDIVHAHYGTATAFLCACISCPRLVITYRGSDLNGCPGIGSLRKFTGILLSQVAALRADAIICVSLNLVHKLWWRNSRVSIVPSGVDMKLFFPDDKSRARRLLGLGDHEKVVLFNAGREPAVKGLELAKRVLASAEQLVGPIRLVILNGDVPAEKVPMYINASDCVLLCSLAEGSPNIVKEALACNVPVVAVNVGDVKALLAGVYPSALSYERDPQKLGAALAAVLRVGTRCNGRQMVEKISNDRIAAVICNIYKGLLVNTEC